MTTTGRLLVDWAATLTGSADFQTPSAPLAYAKQFTFDNGSGANQISKVWADQRTLSASATEDLDLAGGVTDALGTTLTFSKIRLLAVYAAAGNTNLVQVGGAASNQLINWVADATDVVQVRPGGLLLLAAPDATAYAVTASTGDLLKVANSAGTTSVTYDILVAGS